MAWGIIKSFKCGGSISRATTPYPFLYICTILIEKAPSFVDLSLQKGTCTSLQAYLRILHPFSIPLEATLETMLLNPLILAEESK